MNGTLFEKHLLAAEIEAGLEHVLAAPKDDSRLEMIVRRPAVNKREVTDAGVLDRENGLIGDNWFHRGSSRTDN